MATLKQRLHRKNADGGYDVVHLETSASVVMRADGSTSVEQSLTEIESWDLLKYEEAGDYAGMPYMEDDASTLEGHPASDFVLAANANFAPSTHNHTKSQITDFSHSHSKSEITDFPTTMTPSVHTHAAGDVTSGTLSTDRIPGLAASKITSGTLSIARGGTGVTSNPSMLVNLGSTSAASVFAASPRPGVTGTLPVARGGTGVTSLDALKTALGGISVLPLSSYSGTHSGKLGKTEENVLNATINIPASLYWVIKITVSGSANLSTLTDTSDWYSIYSPTFNKSYDIARGGTNGSVNKTFYISGGSLISAPSVGANVTAPTAVSAEFTETVYVGTTITRNVNISISGFYIPATVMFK